MNHTNCLPLEHWGFERWPFTLAPAADQLYATAGYTEALARIEYLIDSRRRLGVLVGAAGVGKSQVLQTAARQLSKQGAAIARVEAIGISARELLWQAAAAFGTTPAEDADTSRLWRQIADRVAQCRLQKVPAVLLVDDADQAGPDIITQLVRLARIDTSPAARWTMVLAAEPTRAARWNEALRDLVDLRIMLRPWELDETVGYVQTALVDAGRFEPLFDEAALTTLHELTGGVPRQVTRLADFALLAGAAAGAEGVDQSLVLAAQDELSWPDVAIV